MKLKQDDKILLLGLIFFISVLFGVSCGSIKIPLSQLFDDANKQILFLRVLRVLLAAVVGAGLGVSGVILQSILKNPLADPYLLGTSSGAGLGAVLAVIAGMASSLVPFVAFLGALGSMILVYSIAKEQNKIPVQSLVLSGVIVAVAFSGIIVFLVSVSPNEALHGMMWWLLGSLQNYDVKLLIIIFFIVALGIMGTFIFSHDLNAISLGEEHALHLGIDVELTKKFLLLITSFMTGAIVSVSGMIGFVGLIVPHIMRLYTGPNHKMLIPSTCLGAAAFLVFCDTLARSLFPPVEIPIGVITSLVGAPVFIILLKQKRRVN